MKTFQHRFPPIVGQIFTEISPQRKQTSLTAARSPLRDARGCRPIVMASIDSLKSVFNTNRPKSRLFRNFGRLVSRAGLAGGSAPNKAQNQSAMTWERQ